MSRPRRLVLLAALTAGVAAVAPAAAQAASSGQCRPDGGPRCTFWFGKVPAGGVGDGDTLTVNYDGRSERVRITGIQAMEMTRYSSYPSRRRGECHSVEATARLEALLRRSGGRVRIAAQNPASRAGHRLRRSVAVYYDGAWHDVGRKLVAEGHALWLPNGTESAWNRTYSYFSQKAAVRGRRLWDRDYCRRGPGGVNRVSMSLNPDADGNDGENANGEYAIIRNRGARPLPIAGWRFRDSSLRWYTFPRGSRILADSWIRIRAGKGTRSAGQFFWGLSGPPFENSGDGGYLFDQHGDLRAAVIYPCRFAC